MPTSDTQRFNRDDADRLFADVARGDTAPSIPQVATSTDPDELWRREWAASPKLQIEFRRVETYLAYQKAIAAGLVQPAAGASKPAAAVPRAEGAKPTIDLAGLEAACRTEFAQSGALRAEFSGKVERYIAFRCAEAQGCVRIFGAVAGAR